MRYVTQTQPKKGRKAKPYFLNILKYCVRQFLFAEHVMDCEFALVLKPNFVSFAVILYHPFVIVSAFWFQCIEDVVIYSSAYYYVIIYCNLYFIL